MYDYADIYAFLAQELGLDPAQLTPDVSLWDDLGVDGDDFFELEEAYAKRFNVDISGYRWYFHHRDEGFLFAPERLFFRPPYNPIAVTPKMLLEAANAGKWSLEYPAHKGPPRRFDILAVIAILVCIIGLVPPAVMRVITFFGRLFGNGR